MELTDFLLARIAEDEAVAAAARPGPWRQQPHHDDGIVEVVSADGWHVVETYGEPNVPHIARHDPARVLAECEAKRDVARVIISYRGQPYSPVIELMHQRILGALALPYAGHPDYREQWRP